MSPTDAAYRATPYPVVCLPIYPLRRPSPTPIPYQRSSAVPTDTSLRAPTDTLRRLPCLSLLIHDTSSPATLQRTIQTHIYYTINNMVERACGCVPCVTCKRMFKGRGLSLHATRTGCGNRWFQLDGTTYDTRWNETMQTLPCSCAMK